MNRRRLLASLPALPAASLFSQSAGADLKSPYEAVDWDTWVPLQSMSHQHQGLTDASRDTFVEMGYQHFAFSNYYPSKPTYPIPAGYLERHPHLVCAPNAEQHSFTDAGLHCNSLGSMLTTGYGQEVDARRRAQSPLVHRFEGLNVYSPERPWTGVYRMDVRLSGEGGASPTRLTVEGGVECSPRDGFTANGEVHDRELPVGNHTFYFRTTQSALQANLVYDQRAITVSQFRLMQGTNRPWRDVFRAVLDGEMADGVRQGGLLYPEGGGITLNHPTGKLSDYLPMLDFDPRVLGIEVWNQLTSGFGSSKGFYDSSGGPLLHFYQLWDEILRTGCRCWGFFVKDHNTFGRGRNVLLVPKVDEKSALLAYRNGAFFGAVSSLAANDSAEVVAPYDKSDFRFSRLEVIRDEAGRAKSVVVEVKGNDPQKRPGVQIRFVTDKGVARIADGSRAEFHLNREASGRLEALFVRVEAFAYPPTQAGGKALTAGMLAQMNVHEISQIHQQKALRGPAFFATEPALRTPIPTVDMIFSQPLRRV